MVRIDLRDVTVCAADTLNPALAGRALSQSARHCAFGDAILFTDRQIEGAFRSVEIEPLRSRHDYSRFVLRQLHAHIATPFALVVQWDGFVLNGILWTSAFFDYDYIGAPWPWHPTMRVGNGGFSLRSKRLLEASASLPDLPAATNEDEFICKTHRHRLEQEQGLVFASEAVAERFSFERGVPDRPTFGFHGMFNMSRCLSDADVEEIARNLDDRTVMGRDYLECVLSYWAQRRFAPMAALYHRWRSFMTVGEVREFVPRFIGKGQSSAAFLEAAEAAVQMFGPTDALKR